MPVFLVERTATPPAVSASPSFRIIGGSRPAAQSATGNRNDSVSPAAVAAFVERVLHEHCVLDIREQTDDQATRLIARIWNRETTAIETIDVLDTRTPTTFENYALVDASPDIRTTALSWLRTRARQNILEILTAAYPKIGVGKTASYIRQSRSQTGNSIARNLIPRMLADTSRRGYISAIGSSEAILNQPNYTNNDRTAIAGEPQLQPILGTPSRAIIPVFFLPSSVWASTIPITPPPSPSARRGGGTNPTVPVYSVSNLFARFHPIDAYIEVPVAGIYPAGTRDNPPLIVPLGDLATDQQAADFAALPNIQREIETAASHITFELYDALQFAMTTIQSSEVINALRIGFFIPTAIGHYDRLEREIPRRHAPAVPLWESGRYYRSGQLVMDGLGYIYERRTRSMPRADIAALRNVPPYMSAAYWQHVAQQYAYDALTHDLSRRPANPSERLSNPSRIAGEPPEAATPSLGEPETVAEAQPEIEANIEPVVAPARRRRRSRAEMAEARAQETAGIVSGIRRRFDSGNPEEQPVTHSPMLVPLSARQVGERTELLICYRYDPRRPWNVCCRRLIDINDTEAVCPEHGPISTPFSGYYGFETNPPASRQNRPNIIQQITVELTPLIYGPNGEGDPRSTATTTDVLYNLVTDEVIAAARNHRHARSGEIFLLESRRAAIVQQPSVDTHDPEAIVDTDTALWAIQETQNRAAITPLDQDTTDALRAALVPPTDPDYQDLLNRPLNVRYCGMYVPVNLYRPRDIVCYGLNYYTARSASGVFNPNLPTNRDYWTQLNRGRLGGMRVPDMRNPGDGTANGLDPVGYPANPENPTDLASIFFYNDAGMEVAGSGDIPATLGVDIGSGADTSVSAPIGGWTGEIAERFAGRIVQCLGLATSEGTLVFRYRGYWSNDIGYAANDIVYYNRSLWIVITEIGVIYSHRPAEQSTMWRRIDDNDIANSYIIDSRTNVEIDEQRVLEPIGNIISLAHSIPPYYSAHNPEEEISEEADQMCRALADRIIGIITNNRTVEQSRCVSYRGRYNFAQQYQIHDLVYYRGVLYVAQDQNQYQRPWQHINESWRILSRDMIPFISVIDTRSDSERMTPRLPDRVSVYLREHIERLFVVADTTERTPALPRRRRSTARETTPPEPPITVATPILPSRLDLFARLVIRPFDPMYESARHLTNAYTYYGRWQGDRYYGRNSIVYWLGNLFVANSANNGIEPEDTISWQILIEDSIRNLGLPVLLANPGDHTAENLDPVYTQIMNRAGEPIPYNSLDLYTTAEQEIFTEFASRIVHPSDSQYESIINHSEPLHYRGIWNLNSVYPLRSAVYCERRIYVNTHDYSNVSTFVHPRQSRYWTEIRNTQYMQGRYVVDGRSGEEQMNPHLPDPILSLLYGETNTPQPESLSETPAQTPAAPPSSGGFLAAQIDAPIYSHFAAQFIGRDNPLYMQIVESDNTRRYRGVWRESVHYYPNHIVYYDNPVTRSPDTAGLYMYIAAYASMGVPPPVLNGSTWRHMTFDDLSLSHVVDIRTETERAFRSEIDPVAPLLSGYSAPQSSETYTVTQIPPSEDDPWLAPLYVQLAQALIIRRDDPRLETLRTHPDTFFYRGMWQSTEDYERNQIVFVSYYADISHPLSGLYICHTVSENRRINPATEGIQTGHWRRVTENDIAIRYILDARTPEQDQLAFLDPVAQILARDTPPEPIDISVYLRDGNFVTQTTNLTETPPPVFAPVPANHEEFFPIIRSFCSQFVTMSDPRYHQDTNFVYVGVYNPEERYYYNNVVFYLSPDNNAYLYVAMGAIPNAAERTRRGIPSVSSPATDTQSWQRVIGIENSVITDMRSYQEIERCYGNDPVGNILEQTLYRPGAAYIPQPIRDRRAHHTAILTSPIPSPEDSPTVEEPNTENVPIVTSTGTISANIEFTYINRDALGQRLPEILTEPETIPNPDGSYTHTWEDSRRRTLTPNLRRRQEGTLTDRQLNAALIAFARNVAAFAQQVHMPPNGRTESTPSVLIPHGGWSYLPFELTPQMAGSLLRGNDLNRNPLISVLWLLQTGDERALLSAVREQEGGTTFVEDNPSRPFPIAERVDIRDPQTNQIRTVPITIPSIQIEIETDDGVRTYAVIALLRRLYWFRAGGTIWTPLQTDPRQPNDCGIYDPHTAYYPNDIVEFNGDRYLAVLFPDRQSPADLPAAYRRLPTEPSRVQEIRSGLASVSDGMRSFTDAIRATNETIHSAFGVPADRLGFSDSLSSPRQYESNPTFNRMLQNRITAIQNTVADTVADTINILRPQEHVASESTPQAIREMIPGERYLLLSEHANAPISGLFRGVWHPVSYSLGQFVVLFDRLFRRSVNIASNSGPPLLNAAERCSNNWEEMTIHNVSDNDQWFVGRDLNAFRAPFSGTWLPNRLNGLHCVYAYSERYFRRDQPTPYPPLNVHGYLADGWVEVFRQSPRDNLLTPENRSLSEQLVEANRLAAERTSLNEAEMVGELTRILEAEPSIAATFGSLSVEQMADVLVSRGYGQRTIGEMQADRAAHAVDREDSLRRIQNLRGAIGATRDGNRIIIDTFEMIGTFGAELAESITNAGEIWWMERYPVPSLEDTNYPTLAGAYLTRAAMRPIEAIYSGTFVSGSGYDIGNVVSLLETEGPEREEHVTRYAGMTDGIVRYFVCQTRSIPSGRRRLPPRSNTRDWIELDIRG